MRPPHRTLLIGILACVSLALNARSADQSGDEVVSRGVVRGELSGLAIDGAGNRYLAGTFYEAQDFNPNAGADIKAPAGSSDIYLTRFNADGSYAWTATFGAASSAAYAGGVVISGGTVYVAGSLYDWSQVDPKATPTASSPVNQAIVVAFDSATGSLNPAFGTKGAASFSGANGASANALSAAGGTLYVTGEVDPDYSTPLADGSSPTAHPFVWALSLPSGSALAGFGSGGAVILDSIAGNGAGNGIAVTANAVFVAGSAFQFSFFPPLSGLPGGGPVKLPTKGRRVRGSPVSDLIPFTPPVRNAFIASLSLTTGALNTNFAAGGIKIYGTPDSATGNGIAAANGVVYITGAYSKAPSPTAAAKPGTASPLNSLIPIFFQPQQTDAYVLAVDASSGVESATFGTQGVVFFGRQFSDEGTSLALDGETLYVAGGYGDLYSAGYGGVIPLASPTPSKNPLGPPKPLSAKRTATPGASPIFFGNFGIMDAFVLALDPASGARVNNFSGDGLQTFGGTGADEAQAIATFNGNVFIAGYSYSTDAGVGGLGTIDASTWGGFLISLDEATGGGGGAEVNQAPIVQAGGSLDVVLPEHPGTGDNYYFPGYLSPTILDDGLPNPPGKMTLKWEVVSGPGKVTFEDPTTAFSGVDFSVLGTYVLKVTASDSALFASDTLTVHVTQNHAPVIDSPPFAQPSKANTGDTITFTASAHDPDGDDLDYWWDYGDNNYDDGTSVTHSYDNPGNYTVTLHVSDGIDETVATVKVVISGNPVFTIDNLNFTVDFSGAHHSGLSVTGTLGGIPKGNLSGLAAALNAGGAQGSFTLNSKGADKNSDGSFSLKRAGKVYKFSAKLGSAAVENPTATNGNSFGLSNTVCSNVAVSVPVTLSLGTASFQGKKTVKYSTANNMAKGK